MHTLNPSYALSVCLGLAATNASAGDLNPPPGPVAPTHKSLTEVEPRTPINATTTPGDSDSLFKISQPGSYYLTGNVTGVVGKHGIEIAASGVTVDLSGFDVLGVPGMGAFDGVAVTVGGLFNISVMNGSVRNWGDEGVDLGSFGSINGRVVGVVAIGNLGIGIHAGSRRTISDCSANQNAGNGISASTGCAISNCSVTQNGSNGISASQSCVIYACASDGNMGDGIVVSTSSTVFACSANRNSATGIATGDSCTIVNNAANENAGSGITAGAGCTVANCTVRLNSLDGIMCSSSCVIRDNACSTNGAGAGDGAGIHVFGSDVRIESNNCIGADRGIDVDLEGNTIIRNSCSGNTVNWDVVAGNVIYVIGTNAAAAVTGNSGGTDQGATDANVNWTY